MLFERCFKSWNRFRIKSEDQLVSRLRGKNLVEENFEVWVWDGFEAEGRLAHFPNTLAQRADVLGAKMSVETERHLEFIDRLGGDAGRENLVQPLERVMIP